MNTLEQYQEIQMISIEIILTIVFLHWFADFILQSDWMAQNKSSSNKALGLHIIVYTIPLMYIGFLWAIVNGILHFITDYVTSRITKKLWSNQQVHWFFVVIGLDQMIHYFCLFGTYYIMFK